MKEYKTKQKEVILNYLKQNAEKDLTVETIVNYVTKKNKKCSQTTIYRYLKQLVDDGIIRKYYIDNSTSSYYQYISSKKCNEHLHFKCEKCGKTIHLEDFDIDKIEDILQSRYHITINSTRTVLYGKCQECV